MFTSYTKVGKYQVKIIKTISQGAYGFVYLAEIKNGNG